MSCIWHISTSLDNRWTLFASALDDRWTFARYTRDRSKQTNAILLQTALAQLTYLNDAALWQAARATLSAEQRERMAELHDKQQRQGLTSAEQTEEKALLTYYRETLLIRAQAAVLLKQRTYDVSDPTQFHPVKNYS